MSVNGSGANRDTKKLLPDSTSWTVKFPTGEVATYAEKGKIKDAVGLSAADAFDLARKYRRTGQGHVIPVRT